LRADVYCYACDDARVDPNIAQHLSTFGIEVASQKKTEKSMTELVRPLLLLGSAALALSQHLTPNFALSKSSRTSRSTLP